MQQQVNKCYRDGSMGVSSSFSVAMASLSNVVMSFGHARRMTLFLLLAAILQPGTSQTKCDIDVQYCQGQCEMSSCTAGGSGFCDQQGRCTCNEGYKISPRSPYQCDKITCPSEGPENLEYCNLQCGQHCQYGTCYNGGACVCVEGFEKEPGKLYKCNRNKCPSVVKEDEAFCQNECDRNCKNGKCDNVGTCICFNGFKKSPGKTYQCDKIICPSYVREDKYFCESQCISSCKNGKCYRSGRCTCAKGFKKATGSLYQCDQIHCPSIASEDHVFCRRQCIRSCLNGWCDDRGTCTCHEGFKKLSNFLYQCSPIICTSFEPEDQVYCKTACYKKCLNGWCDNLGTCTCNFGFTKDSTKLYECAPISCPSPRVQEWQFCKSACEVQCVQGACNESGECVCNEGFKSTGYECTKVTCPASSWEDDAYCKARCDASCNDGKCSERGVCRKCVVTCDDKLSCPPSKPRCSQHGFCSDEESQDVDCTTECISQCTKCDREDCDMSDGCHDYDDETEEVVMCSRRCIGTWCERIRGDRKWIITTFAVLSFLVVIGIGVWVWHRRRACAWGGHVAVTEHLELGPTQESGRRPLPGKRECESYLEPRRFQQEPGGDDPQYHLYEMVADVVTDKAGKRSPVEPEYMQMADLCDPAAAEPVYVNGPTAQDEQLYENFAGLRRNYGDVT